MKVFAEKEINGNRSKRVLWTLVGGGNPSMFLFGCVIE